MKIKRIVIKVSGDVDVLFINCSKVIIKSKVNVMICNDINGVSMITRKTNFLPIVISYLNNISFYFHPTLLTFFEFATTNATTAIHFYDARDLIVDLTNWIKYRVEC